MTRNTRNWRRMPGRRTSAAVLAAAVAATGITYAGLQLGDSAPRHDVNRERKTDSVTEAAAIDRAAKTGKPVEVTALHTSHSTTWARPDGLMAKRLYSSPIRAKVGGEWKPIDYNLGRTKDGWEPAATNTRMVFSAGSKGKDREGHGEQRASRSTVQRASLVKGVAAAADAIATPLVTLHVGDHDIQLTWPGPVPTPIIDGSRALYPEIFPGADLVLTADDDGFAQLLVLKNRQAAADPQAQQLAYGISSTSLTFRLDPVSGIVTAEDAYADEVAMSPTPLMWDSSGTPAVTDGSVGATAQPTASEAPGPTDSASATPSDSASPTATEEEEVESDEQADPSPEDLPSASDGPEPTVSESPLPSAPPEPTPSPSQTGSSSTLSLPSLDGPSPTPAAMSSRPTCPLGPGRSRPTRTSSPIRPPRTRSSSTRRSRSTPRTGPPPTVATPTPPSTTARASTRAVRTRPASASSPTPGARHAPTSTSPSTRTSRARRSPARSCACWRRTPGRAAPVR